MKKLFFSVGLCVVCLGTPSVSQNTEHLSLNDAITIALEHHPQALASSEQIHAEVGRFWRGISPPPPSASINYLYVPSGAAIDRFGERSLEISQSIDFPTTMYFRVRQLATNVSAAEAEQRAAAIAIVCRVKTAYYDVLARQKKIRLMSENLGIAEEFANKAAVRCAVGEATNLERLTASVQRVQAQSAVDAAQNGLKASLGEFSLALGRGRDHGNRELILTDSLVFRSIGYTLDQLIELALAVNPQLTVADRKAAAASFGKSLAWSSILPNLSASYYRQTVDGNPNLFGFSLGISVPLWFMFDQRGQIEEASANVNIAEYDLRAAANAITADVKNAYYDLENNERQIQLHQSDILPQAEEVFRTARASYEAGEINYMEYQQARQLLLTSQNEYIDELSLYCSSLAKLEAVVGTQLLHP